MDKPKYDMENEQLAVAECVCGQPVLFVVNYKKKTVNINKCPKCGTEFEIEFTY